MATRAQLEKYAKNPNVRKFLDLIAHTEGTEGNGYRTAFGGGRLSSLNDHPRYSKSFTQKNGKTNKTSAAGRYQFLRGTWDGLARQYGLNDFSPKNQDLGAIGLLIQNRALGDILKGDMQGAVRKSGATWASLPTAPASYSQPTKSWKAVNKFLGGKGVSSVPQQQFERPQRIPIADLQAQQQQFARPERVPISQLQEGKQASVFQRPERVPVSQLQAPEQSVFERPQRVPVSELEATEQTTDIFQRPERVPIEQLQSSNELNPMLELQPQQM